MRGVDHKGRATTGGKASKATRRDDSDNEQNGDDDGGDGNEDDDDDDDDDEEFGGGGKAKKKAKKDAAGGKSSVGKDEQMYYRITCKDNGCGMPHERIPDFLGRVLAGSKYGVRQTRGKFGLGAKMALIWSKKSTGLPISVKTAHAVQGKGGAGAGSSSSAGAAAADGSADGAASSAAAAAGLPAAPVSTASIKPPPRVSFCKLDIDIYKNQPHVLEHTLNDNTEGWIGTEISVTISGAWSSYRSRVMHYFQQLAVITPYAQFGLHYKNSCDTGRGKGDFSYVWHRRSNQIPPLPMEVKHHPSSVNDLLVQQLMDQAKAKASTSNIVGFLTSQFQCIDRPLAVKIVNSMGGHFTPDMQTSTLTAQHVHSLTRRLATEKSIAAPSGDCLSPAGEYNLRLGIMKELHPDLVATCTAAVSVFEGHPFIVEAGVALGGQGPEGLTVHRFANRIPLLFEGGADVATKTATTRIPWATYKIDPNRDKVGVFVSLVSTKIPFKGTGKEYIGDDIQEIRDAVKEAVQACCAQLRVKLLRAQAARARANRRKNLTKYIPDVVRAVMAGLKAVTARRAEQQGGGGRPAGDDDEGDGHGAGSKRKRRTGHAGPLPLSSPLTAVLSDYASGKVNDKELTTNLMSAVEKADMDAALEAATAATPGMAGAAGGADDGGAEGGAGALQVYLAPTGIGVYKEAKEIHHSTCVIKLLPGAIFHPPPKA